MPAAARVGDTHVCASHAGGAVLTGCPTVLIGTEPAARVGDVADCESADKDKIESGCETVFIGAKAAARVFDATDGGHLTSGAPHVQIGPSGSPLEAQERVRRFRRKKRSGK